MSKDKPKYYQIIDAALEVIAENGYHSSQVSKIAKRASVADGTIYLYFKNKEDILVSVFNVKMGTFIKNIVDKIEKDSTAYDKLLTLIKEHYRQLAELPYLAVVAQLELRQSKAELRQEINRVLKSYLDVIDAIIDQVVKEGSIRHDVNPRIMRQMIFGTLDETVTTWVMKGQRYSLVDQAEEVHQLLAKGFFK